MRYTKGGPGIATPILFLHGLFGSARDWDAVLEHLPGIPFICADLPGHGRSTGLSESAYSYDGVSDRLRSILDVEGIRRVVICGYSMGGRLGLYFASRNPDRVRGLILESVNPGIEDAYDRAARLARDMSTADKIERTDLRSFLESWYRKPMFGSLSRNSGALSAVVAQRLGNRPADLARALRGLSVGRQTPMYDVMQAGAFPTLLIAGSEDERYAVLARSLVSPPDVVARIVEGAGHNVHLDKPKDFAAHVARHLNANETVGHDYVSR